MKTSDYIIKFLIEKETDTVFVYTGGAIAHVIDSLGKYNDDIKYVCVQHEQVGAIAAEAYSRTTSKMGVAMVTSGPGATNLITGIVGAWYDCIPAMYFTGQVRTWELTGNDHLLQRGFQEVDIVKIVKPITKYAITVTKKEDIRYELEKAFYLAKTGRPGPVLLDLPMDIQWSDINPEELSGFIPDSKESQSIDTELIPIAINMIYSAKKPVIVGGGGIRHANTVTKFREFVERTGIPAVFSYAGKDLLPENHPLNGGVMGQFGQHFANVITQNADLIIALGTRFNIRQAGNNIDEFAKNANIISVNIDSGELKDCRVKADLSIPMDIKDFFHKIDGLSYKTSFNWISFIKKIKTENPLLKQSYRETISVNPYLFVDTLSEKVEDNAIIIPDAGQNVIVSSQAFKVRSNQRFFSSWANSPMGYSFPASIGAQFGSPDKQVICIIGDGGMQINIQDLQTIRFYSLPIKIFIINNHVYGAILEFQDTALDGRYEATDKEHGYSHPNYEKVISAYEIMYYRIGVNNELNIIDEVLNQSGPVVCEILVDPVFRIDTPKQKPDKPLIDPSLKML